MAGKAKPEIFVLHTHLYLGGDGTVKYFWVAQLPEQQPKVPHDLRIYFSYGLDLPKIEAMEKSLCLGTSKLSSVVSYMTGQLKMSLL